MSWKRWRGSSSRSSRGGIGHCGSVMLSNGNDETFKSYGQDVQEGEEDEE